ncbi:MAG: hypothetical protein NVS1B3_07780 [Candidatus Dormibacteraceae bacterium]
MPEEAVMQRVTVDDAELEYEVQGDGEPVLLIPLSVIIDGLARPLFGRSELARKYQLIHYHRRGYVGSSRGTEPLTIPRQAADAAALLRHLNVERAHVAGHSYGGIIALQLVLDAPVQVHSLALLEPALRAGPMGKAHLERTVGPARQLFLEGDQAGFVVSFTDGVFGPGWQPVLERRLPGAMAQAIADASTFFEEQPALLQWKFGRKEAARIKQPVLSLLGRRSAPIFQEGRAVFHEWLPQTEDWDVDSTHMLQIEDPGGVARGLAEFFGRHPMPANAMATGAKAD